MLLSLYFKFSCHHAVLVYVSDLADHQHFSSAVVRTSLFLYLYEKENKYKLIKFSHQYHEMDRLCGLVVRVPRFKSRGPGSIPGATRFSEE
jgi:hypothetical protein